jgi:hypothetical protein
MGPRRNDVCIHRGRVVAYTTSVQWQWQWQWRWQSTRFVGCYMPKCIHLTETHTSHPIHNGCLMFSMSLNLVGLDIPSPMATVMHDETWSETHLTESPAVDLRNPRNPPASRASGWSSWMFYHIGNLIGSCLRTGPCRELSDHEQVSLKVCI